VARLERASNLVHGEDRPDREIGVAGRDENRRRGRESFDNTRRGPRVVGALVANRVHVVLVRAPDEPLLERKLARRRVDVSSQPIVRGREDVRVETCLLGELGSNVR